ncbi:MAG: hypothetical protein OXI44_03480 [Bacteroidota bacterium]|nr:hypothetical protein [Bacteroidota bacterium]
MTIQLIYRVRRVITSRYAFASGRANLIIAAVMKFLEVLVEDWWHNAAFPTWDEATGAEIDNCIECDAERLRKCLGTTKECDSAWKACGIAHDK